MIDALVPDRLRYLLQSLQINEALRELNCEEDGDRAACDSAARP